MEKERVYLPTFADLIDRLSICILKRIFISKNAEEYSKEIKLIKQDIDSILKERLSESSISDNEYVDVLHHSINADMIEAIMIIMLSNRYIWENESKVREGNDQDIHLLKITHSINGVRNLAKNIISKEMGERVDLKIDCLAADLPKECGNWNIFNN
jgi:hypothetical protein